jgi:hypothetical protein
MVRFGNCITVALLMELITVQIIVSESTVTADGVQFHTIYDLPNKNSLDFAQLKLVAIYLWEQDIFKDKNLIRSPVFVKNIDRQLAKSASSVTITMKSLYMKQKYSDINQSPND